jgi:Protein of unknown function (DUF2480)
METEITNRVANSGLINFDIADLWPKGLRIGLDIAQFLDQGFVLREKDFRQSIAEMDLSAYQNAYVHLFCSTDAVVPLWAYFLLSAQLEGHALAVVYGDLEALNLQLINQAIAQYDFSPLQDQRVLVKGCTNLPMPHNAYINLVLKLKPLVKNLMFGEACSFVPIYKAPKV